MHFCNRMESRKTVSLALGSGGARGLAHIGVIEVLRDEGFLIERIAGSSIGACVGGIYCAGKLDVFRDWTGGLNAPDGSSNSTPVSPCQSNRASLNWLCWHLRTRKRRL